MHPASPSRVFLLTLLAAAFLQFAALSRIAAAGDSLFPDRVVTPGAPSALLPPGEEKTGAGDVKGKEESQDSSRSRQRALMEDSASEAEPRDQQSAGLLMPPGEDNVEQDNASGRPAYQRRLIEVDAAYARCLDDAQGVAEALRECGDVASDALNGMITEATDRLRRNVEDDPALLEALTADRKAWMALRRALVDSNLADGQGLAAILLADKLWYDLTWRRAELLGYLARSTDPDGGRGQDEKSGDGNEKAGASAEEEADTAKAKGSERHEEKDKD
jgi:uncharacterized protein YecT (DUF1311 family)